MQRFTSRVDQTLASWNFPQALDSYLRYKSTGLDTPSSEQLAQLLTVAASGSIVDLYETFVDVVIYVLTARRAHELGLEKTIPALLTRLSGRVKDYRLHNLLRMASSTPVAAGGMKEAESVTGEMTILRRLVLTARGSALLEKKAQPDSLEARLARQLSTILMRDPDAEANAQDLLKFSLNHPFLRENTFLLNAATEGRSAAGFSIRSAAAGFCVCDPAPLPPIDPTSADIDSTLYASLDAANPPHPLAATTDTQTIAGSAHARTEALLESRQFSAAEAWIAQIEERGDQFDKLLAIRHRFSLLKGTGQSWAAISLAAGSRVEKPGFRRELPLRDLLIGVPWRSLRDNEGDIRLPIAIYMALAEEVQTADSELHALLRQALRRLLHYHGVTSCADLDAQMLRTSNASVVFLFRYVCVENYLTGLPSIDTSKALTQERVRILQRLHSLDSANASYYEEEIRDLTYRLELQEGVESFDRSRVFVNLDGIRRWAKRALREDLLRYQSLIEAGSDTLAALQDAVTKLRGNLPLPEALFQQATTEADKVLVDMLLRLRTQYLSSPEDGLDVFLSLRIRHGSLSGNVRGPLEEASLLTLRDEGTGAYRPNEVWADRLGLRGSPRESDFNAAFAQFSSTFDAAINHLIREIVQIKSKEKPDGAFDFPVTLPAVNVIKAQITKSTSFDDFLASAFDVFSALMRSPLQKVKKALQETLKLTVEGALETLRIKLADCVPATQYFQLATALGRASTNVAAAIDRVADWFAPDPLTDPSRTYSIDDLVQMGVQITRTAHAGFAPEVTIRVEPELPSFKMDTGAMVVLDVVYTLLDNVFRRSGIPTSPHVELSVSMPDKNHLEFHMTNDVFRGSRTPQIEQRLQRIRDIIATDSGSQTAASEGGSGFIKLRRIGMNSRSGERTRLTFGYASDSTFEVRVAIPIYTEDTEAIAK